MAHSEGVNHAARLRPGDPLALAGGGGDPAIEGTGELQGHHRATKTDAGEKTALVGARRVLQHAIAHLHPGGAEPGEPLPVDARVWIAQRHHHAGHPGGDQCIGAGRRLAMMGAGFEGNIDRRPARRRTGLRERNHFGMGPPAGLGRATPDDAPVLDDHAAHGRVWPNLPQPPAPERQGQPHEAGVAHPSSGATSGRSSLTNLSKSSAAWKFL